VKLSSVIRWIALLLALVPALVGSGAAEPPRTPRVATLTSVGISSAATTNDASTLASYDPIAKIVTRQQTGPPPPWRRVSATPIYEPFRQEPTDSAGAIAAEDGTAAESAVGSTGRTEASNLTEQLAMQAAQADPAAGRVLPITMTDARWPASDGWVKMAQNISGVEIHYVYNTVTGARALAASPRCQRSQGQASRHVRALTSRWPNAAHTGVAPARPDRLRPWPLGPHPARPATGEGVRVLGLRHRWHATQPRSSASGRRVLTGRPRASPHQPGRTRRGARRSDEQGRGCRATQPLLGNWDLTCLPPATDPLDERRMSHSALVAEIGGAGTFERLGHGEGLRDAVASPTEEPSSCEHVAIIGVHRLSLHMA
jgi:hypothetical protein